jgi:hypothetical protein
VASEEDLTKKLRDAAARAEEAGDNAVPVRLLLDAAEELETLSATLFVERENARPIHYVVSRLLDDQRLRTDTGLLCGDDSECFTRIVSETTCPRCLHRMLEALRT